VKVFMVAGEASGDRLGAALIKGLCLNVPEIEFQGVAGPEMQSHGINSLFDMSELSVMGVSEILPKYRGLKRRLSQTVAAVLKFKPDVLITIDSPDFCLRVAEAVRSADPSVRTVHYVAPTVWAWRPNRAKKMAGFIDHVLALFPFEPTYMKAEGMDCDFVGHPIAAMPKVSSKQVTEFQELIGLDPNRPALVILPGSRHSEIQRLLPVFCNTLSQLDFANLQLIFPTLPHLAALVRDHIQILSQDCFVVTGEGLSANEAAEQRLVAFSAAKAALAASGTVSLELAAAGTPMVIAYNLGLLSRLIIGAMLRVDTVTLVNLVSNTRDVPEFIGKHCRADLIATALIKVLADPHSQDHAMRRTMELLGSGDTALANRAAKAVLARL
jgi:lipid-A-disaccharide synthase